MARSTPQFAPKSKKAIDRSMQRVFKAMEKLFRELGDKARPDKASGLADTMQQEAYDLYILIHDTAETIADEVGDDQD